MAKRAQPAMPSASAFAVPPRTAALAGRIAVHSMVSVTPGGPASRLALRAPQKSRAALSRALGLQLPDKPKTAAAKGSRAALWLGPDEWLVIDGPDADLMAVLKQVSALHSAVDVSHRNQAITVAGPGAEAALSAGCPLVLSPAAFPVGAATRTVLGKAEIVLWRTAAETFRIEVWRSFAPYVLGCLDETMREYRI